VSPRAGAWAAPGDPSQPAPRVRGCPAPADGTERTRRVPGSQTGLELSDLREGIAYLVRVSALVGGREGSAATLAVRLSKSVPGFGAGTPGTVFSPPGMHLSSIPPQALGVPGWLRGPSGHPEVTPWCRGAVQSTQRWAASRSCG